MNPRTAPLRSFVLGLGVTTALIAVGCATPEPRILSSQTKQGKGWPNGRSDSSEPFLTQSRLATSSDASYGYTKENPIRTGSIASRQHILLLNSLRGPKGEPVAYERIGSCCHFEDKALPRGNGLLDVYSLQIDGNADGVKLFFDSYRPGTPMIPLGFTARAQ
jgi:hypothetical protein